MRAVIYTRISDEKQRDGASLETQLAACRKYVESQPDWLPLYELEDVETGLTARREAYQQLLELVRRRSIDIVVVWRLDRFGRDDGELMARYKDLARANVRLVSATEGQQSPFLQKLMFLLANEESRRISERVRPNMRSRAESGLWQGRTPFGYRMDPARKGHLLIEEAEAEIVRHFFDGVVSGLTLNQLARWATERGRFRRNGSFFAPVMVKRILANPVYMGKLRWNVRNSSKLEVDQTVRRDESEWVMAEGKHEPLVSEELWNAAQELLLGRVSPPAGHSFLLSGMVRCGACALAMSGHMYAKPRPHHSAQWAYRCRVPGHPQYGGRRLEKLVKAAVRALPMDGDMLDDAIALLEQSVPPGEHGGERDRLERRLQMATELLLDGTLSREVYRDQRADIEAQIAAIDVQDGSVAAWKRATEESLRALHKVVERYGAHPGDVLDVATPEEVREVLREFVQHVRIHRNAPPEIVWHPLVTPLVQVATTAPQ